MKIAIKQTTNKCPPATQDIHLNLENRQKAIKEYGYGPPDPNKPNENFWDKKADMWQVDDPSEVKSMRCGNCAAFNITKHAQSCIAKGIGSEDDPWSTINAGVLGYCKFLKFKCAGKRTCDAWVEGGPIKD